MPRKKVFISYSHRDEEQAEEIYSQLTGGRVRDELIFYDRGRRGIDHGDEWLGRIQSEARDTRVALFLLSNDFKRSGFITQDEVPLLLRQKQYDPGVRIFWVKLEPLKVPRSLRRFQGFCVDTPFRSLPDGERAEKALEIAEKIEAALGTATDLYDEFEARVEALIRREFTLRLGNIIAYGDHSVVYEAFGEGVRKVVKAQLARAFERGEELTDEDLASYMDNCKDLSHPAFIHFDGGKISDDLQILVSDLVEDATTLRKVLDRGNGGQPGLSVDRVRGTLSTLAAALAEYHDHKLAYGTIRPSDLLVPKKESAPWWVRLPAFRMALLLYLNRRRAKKLTVTQEVLTYLAPEQHHDLRPTAKADQYSLALLGIELLQGEPPVVVQTLNHLRHKEEFFSNPEELEGPWQERSPRLRRILLRMLERDPANRYSDMREVMADLGTFEDLDEDNRRVAKRSFRRLEKDLEARVIEPFYKHLLHRRPRLRTLFEKNEEFDPTEHHKKMKQAILYLLNFREQDRQTEPTTLSYVRESHEIYGLRKGDFEHFESCFLRALKDAGEASEEVQAAWRATIRPGMDYMAEMARKKR